MVGVGVMYQVMILFGFVVEFIYFGILNFGSMFKGVFVLILGVGLVGMMVVYELCKVGYKVIMLEFNQCVGGCCWIFWGGDIYIELGGVIQQCQFVEGNYINLGFWCVLYYYYYVMLYINEFNIFIELFIQVNYNVLVYLIYVFGGKFQCYWEVQVDYQGYVVELFVKVLN